MRSFTSVAAVGACALLSLVSLTGAQYDRYTSGPLISHTFDTRPDVTVRGETRFEWSAGRSPNSGLAQFVNGSRIDLLRYQDDNGKLFPAFLPQTISFEFWAMYQVLGFWSRLIDCGNGANSGNVFMSNTGNDNGYPSNDFHTAMYGGGNGNRGESTTAQNAVHPNTFQHFVATLTRKSRANDSARLDIYVDGVLRATQDNAVLLNANFRRGTCWLGHSNWAADADFRGFIDDFFYYDYALSSEAVLALSLIHI